VTRTALVTGGNRGIGYEICRRLVELGLSVVVAARDLELGRRAAEELGDAARAEQLDVADGESVAACARRLADDSVAVDVLVNNAGLYTTTPLLSVAEPDLIETLEVNFIGAWRTTRAFVPGMRERRYGRVVNMATGYGQSPSDPPRAGA
jgi:NAD(P)-dependent dehydrogenase (short-subunit alcohol dehydrogenase family)